MSVFGIEINKACVCIYEPDVTKTEALDKLVDAVGLTDSVSDVETLRKAVHAREAAMSTGIGNGVGIPHVRIDVVRQPTVGVGISKNGIEFGASDGKKVHILVLFAMPTDSNRLYLGLLAQVMVALKVPNFSERLTNCRTPEEVVEVLNEAGG